MLSADDEEARLVDRYPAVVHLRESVQWLDHHHRQRDLLIVELSAAGMSDRQIAPLAGMSHPGVAKLCRRMAEAGE